jgi:hypothetical protein
MTKRVILAAVLAGLAIFVWGSVTHVVLNLGAVGIKAMPNEDAVLKAMHAAIPEPGFYFFPSMGVGPTAPREQRAAVMAEIEKKAQSGPSGILIFHPNNGVTLTPARLGVEFALNVTQALLAAIVLAWAGGLGSYAARVAFVGVIGIAAALSTNIQYWNWYGFPSNYTGAYIANQVAAFVVAGLVIGAIVKPVAAPVRGSAAVAAA